MWLIPPSMSSAFAPGQRCSMKEFASLCPRRGLWVTSSGKASLREFSWRGWRMRRWSQHLFGADLLKISERGSGVEQWTASLRDSRASRGAPLESSTDSPTTDGCGLRSPGSSMRPMRPSFFLRMCQASLLDEDLIASSETLPRWGSMRSGVIYPQPTWEPPISASEFSFWPSARAEDGESCGNHPNGASDSLTGVTRNWNTPTANRGEGQHQNSKLWQTPATDAFRSRGGDRVDEMGLDQQARMFWPTPQAHDAQGEKTTGQIAAMREKAGAGVSNLNESAAIWQTPTAADHKRSGNFGRGAGSPTLPEEAKNWPTAGANDWKGTAREGQRRGQLDEAAEQKYSLQDLQIPGGPVSSKKDLSSRQRLNPGFAAWLMGMPWFWTSPGSISFARSAMELWRCRLASRLRYLLGEFSGGDRGAQG